MPTLKRDWGRGGSGAPMILATAAINGLGFDSHQSWAFWRAEVTPLAASPFRLRDGERATMTQVRTLPPKSVGVDRLSPLAVAALEQLEPTLAAVPPDAKLSVILCLSERFEDRGEPYFGPQRRHLERDVYRWLEERGRDPSLAVVAKGHAGLAEALLRGCTALEDGGAEVLVVGGVDSYYDPLVVDILMEEERIFDGARSDGFIPGEGAAFALVGRYGMARQCRLPTLAAVETAVSAEEPASMASDEPCTGVGLTKVMRGCIERLREEGRLLEWYLGDVTNEAYRAYEFQLAFPRAVAPGGLDTAGETFGEVAVDELQGHFLPAEFGDLGAATMPTALVLACESFVRGRPRARNCLIFGSSVTADRGAVLLSSAERNGDHSV